MTVLGSSSAPVREITAKLAELNAGDVPAGYSWTYITPEYLNGRLFAEEYGEVLLELVESGGVAPGLGTPQGRFFSASAGDFGTVLNELNTLAKLGYSWHDEPTAEFWAEHDELLLQLYADP